MKKLICIIPLLFIWIPGIDNPINGENSLKKEIKIEKLTNFQIAFNRIHKFEGYYVNHPKDKGKETYRGISRRFNKNWIGWYKIDKIKKENGIPKWNQQFEEVDFWVTDFYLSWWLSEGYDKIKDPEIASYTFEFLIHGVDAKKIIRRTVNKQFPDIYISYKEIPEYLNYVDKSVYIKELQKERLRYYTNIVKRDTSQKIFLNHWLKRINL